MHVNITLHCLCFPCVFMLFRFTTPQETPRDSISGAGSFYNTPDCSPRIYSRHHSEGDATPSVNNSDADNTGLYLSVLFC